MKINFLRSKYLNKLFDSEHMIWRYCYSMDGELQSKLGNIFKKHLTKNCSLNSNLNAKNNPYFIYISVSTDNKVVVRSGRYSRDKDYLLEHWKPYNEIPIDDYLSICSGLLSDITNKGIYLHRINNDILELNRINI